MVPGRPCSLTGLRTCGTAAVEFFPESPLTTVSSSRSTVSTFRARTLEGHVRLIRVDYAHDRAITTFSQAERSAFLPSEAHNGKRRDAARHARVWFTLEQTQIPCIPLKGSTMPLTKLDLVPALVVIDLQKGVVGLPTVRPATEIIGRTAQLASAFRERGLPVVLKPCWARFAALRKSCCLPQCAIRRW